MVRKVCKICRKKLIHNNIYGYCNKHRHLNEEYKERQNSYIKKRYKTDKKFREKQNELSSKFNRKNFLIKRFGFVPVLYLYNKGVSADGCFYGNSKVVSRYKTSNNNPKLMWLYKLNDIMNQIYKIQIARPKTNEEFWFKIKGKEEEVIKFFNKFKSCVTDLSKLEIDRTKINEVNKIEESN